MTETWQFLIVIGACCLGSFLGPIAFDMFKHGWKNDR